METHVRVLFTHNSSGRLVAIREPYDPDMMSAPRVFLGRTSEGNVIRFRHDLPVDVVAELETILASEPIADDLAKPPVNREAIENILNEHAPVKHVWHGPAFAFPEPLPITGHNFVSNVSEPDTLRHWFPSSAEVFPDILPCVAVIRDGAAVAVCRSVRSTPDAAEAGVETVTAFRKQGFGVAVVAHWAQRVREAGRTPLYSTSWTNHASRALASRLGLVMYGDDLHFT